ncbi:dissimilatory adenylylsulfate reductase alpha subunit precursor [Lacrimispora sphenoides]|jgi:adenylylsulfate reductase subunit A|uniref:adenylyl-sulfate reductase subunit alpha n=1 Tax=Lacrimispora sphenoides TaxID=29370 RepID=UPI0008D62B75|nr:adenylyl-sulfate reductase subunit alpha [Lacrimispora sphenoides]SET75322.1 dissimilatory adenylylsulfate reductase alpha subunit precursor [Lacrimispora sphenoides]
MEQVNKMLRTEYLETDFLIIGGGTAGCYAALTFSEQSCGHILITDKADIRRSGCLAAGVNAINAYIVPGKTPQDYVDYARNDAQGIVRGDLLLTMAERLNRTAQKLEGLGLTILKDEKGGYTIRGNRNIKINGENIKPILADAVSKKPDITVMNRVNVFEYLVKDNLIQGAYAVSIDEPVLYVLTAKAVLCATGGAAGLYRPNHPGFSRHKMWYPPFNTGAGYAMGILAGAEMTTLEMRFIALRCKDTIAPTGTLAQGVGAKQINSLGEIYEQKYGLTTSQRLHGTMTENREGRGPCTLRTMGITAEQDEDLQRAYLNMAPSQTLRWLESGETPRIKNVEIEGTEPYIVGGHTASGYWVDTNRETTIKGLFAAGDVAGGCPQKYVTGAFAEGEIAANSAVSYISREAALPDAGQVREKKLWLEQFLSQEKASVTTDGLEEKMQSVMDQYAGGIGSDYRFSEDSLRIADGKVLDIQRQANALAASDMQELVYILELRERLILCRSVIAHLAARRETRWHSFAENTDYPDISSEMECYVNSRFESGNLKILFRPLVGEGEAYEH